MNIKTRWKDGRGEAKDVEEDDEKGGIFTYAEGGWVIPSSDSSRHTGDMWIPLRGASERRRVYIRKTQRQKKKHRKIKNKKCDLPAVAQSIVSRSKAAAFYFLSNYFLEQPIDCELLQRYDLYYICRALIGFMSGIAFHTNRRSFTRLRVTQLMKLKPNRFVLGNRDSSVWAKKLLLAKTNRLWE